VSPYGGIANPSYAVPCTVTGRCGACHRARIRATRWHRPENAAPHPGHGCMASPASAILRPEPRQNNPTGKFSLNPSGKSVL
jgi:hypothetical protein